MLINNRIHALHVQYTLYTPLKPTPTKDIHHLHVFHGKIYIVLYFS